MMRDKDVIDFLAKAVKLGMDALPDSEIYERDEFFPHDKSYVWDECTDEEQEKVKEVRKELNIALEVYEVFKNATKTDQG